MLVKKKRYGERQIMKRGRSDRAKDSVDNVVYFDKYIQIVILEIGSE